MGYSCLAYDEILEQMSKYSNMSKDGARGAAASPDSQGELQPAATGQHDAKEEGGPGGLAAKLRVPPGNGYPDA